jgi:hypothetical protein
VRQHGAFSTEPGDYHYNIVANTRVGGERVHRYANAEPLEPGDVVWLEGRYLLIETVAPDGEGLSGRAVAKPARYRLTVRHPEGREEVGVFRRYRPESPGLGHSFSILEDGHPVGWEVVDRRLARDGQGEPYIELIAERDYSELDEPPDHELEHALARPPEELPQGVEAVLTQAEQRGLSIELAALEPGEEPDWDEAERYLDALILEEIADHLLVLCGVDTEGDAPETWLETATERLRSDLDSFRTDVEGDHDEIEQWSFRGGWIFVSTGREEDEADPYSGHGWMCRLLDAGALGAAGFERVRKAELVPEP